MSKLSFLDKLKIFFEVSKNSFWFPIIMILLLGVAVVLLSNKKKSMKQEKTISIIFSILIVLLVFVVYHVSIANIFDYMMDNLFITIYFPTITIYFAAMIITNIIVWISLINQKTSKLIKRVNMIIYILMNYLLALILNIINTEKLDVFTQSSIYSNKKVTALIELSSIVFMVWIIFLILYRIILVYIRKDYKLLETRSIIKRIENKLPDNYKTIQLPSYIKKLGKVQEENKVIQPIPEIVDLRLETSENTTIKVDPLEEIKKKKEETEKLTKEFEKMLTVEDYHLLLKLLQEQKERGIKKQQEQEQPVLIPIEEYNKKAKQEEIDKQERLKEIRKQKEILEKQKEEALRLERLRIQELKRKELERLQNNFTELELLYRGIMR